nr:hypothetical protein [Deltaproteobacteria bacterium]
MWKLIAREPLVHFIVIGATLFALDAWRGPSRGVEPTPPAAAPPSLPAPIAPPSATGPIVV